MEASERYMSKREVAVRLQKANCRVVLPSLDRGLLHWIRCYRKSLVEPVHQASKTRQLRRVGNPCPAEEYDPADFVILQQAFWNIWSLTDKLHISQTARANSARLRRYWASIFCHAGKRAFSQRLA